MAKKKSSSAGQQQLSFDPAATSADPPKAAPQPAKPASKAARPEREKVFIVDAHSLIYQVFHVMPEMSSPSGQPVGAVHGFIRDIVELLTKEEPDYLFVAFDAPGENFRHTLFPSYKEHREEMPQDLRPQIESTRRMLRALNIPILEPPGFEADDVLATLARAAEERGVECYIVTGDKDCRQLISDLVKVYNIRKNEVFDAAALQTTWGIRPDQVVDFQTLVGDSVDNVPGVPLIGPKIAQELLSKYDTLEGIFAHIDDIAGAKRKENLRNSQEQAKISRELVRLDRFVPIDIDWSAGRVGGLDRNAVRDLCREFGFRQLGDRLAALSIREEPVEWHARYVTIDAVEPLQELVQQIRQAGRVALHVEATSDRPRFAEIVGYSISIREGEAFYIPVRGPAGETHLPPDIVREHLRPILEDPQIVKVGHNLKFDLIVLRSVGVELRGLEFDTMVGDYLLDPGERSHSLEDLAKHHLNHEKPTLAALLGTGKNQRSLDQTPIAEVTQFAGHDADVPLRLSTLLAKRLDEEGMRPLFADLEMPLVQVLAELEYNGIAIDTKLLADLSAKYGQRMAELEQAIYVEAAGEFNINSPKQLGEVLFGRLKLPVVRRTSSGASTDAEVLTELAKHHPLPAKIIEYRQYSKLKTGFVDVLPAMVHPTTGRIHTSFNQDVAATGRLSSADPNLQNIPVRSDSRREIRAAFQPGVPGWKLLCADYSQIELRVLAHYSGDETLLQAFAADEDIHALVASQVYNVPRDQVTRDMRRSAKAINFGIVYGQSAFGLAASLDIPREEAQAFIDAYFAKYPGVDRFMEETLDQARANGYVSTIAGRRRPVQGVRSAASRGNKRQRLLPERIAINSVIQGSAADIIKLAMIRIHWRLKDESWQAKMLLQIHDELVFESPEAELPRLREMAATEMAGVYKLSTPLKVDVKVGENWAECE
jgi:DNA polymerase-1